MSTTPPPDRVFVEQFPEPITGWVMLGVGAAWEAPPSGPLEVEVRYNGVPRVQAPVEVTPTGYHFGVQLPLEPTLARITVVLKSATDEITLFEGAPSDVKPRSAPTPASTPVPRWLSPAVTLGKSVATGEVFSGGWWSARARRYRDLATKARQMVRDKLLIRARHRPRSIHEAYVERTQATPKHLLNLLLQTQRFRLKPTFSILMPVFNVDPKWLAKAIDSLVNQAYPYWELCLADDASTNPATLAYLNRLPADRRIKLVRRTTNSHICAATNSAAELASGEFVALLDNDDALAPHALFAVAELLQSHPDADVIYSDEDKITADDGRYDPQFKPDWSPELLLSYNYVNHFTVLRRSLFEKVGRFRLGYEGSQDHDLLLRVTEQTDRVHHIPEILYHWRALSTARSAGDKPYVHTSGRKAVEDALTRRKVSAKLYVPSFAAKLGLPILALDGADDGPTVAIIVRGPADLAAKTLRAVKQSTAYRTFTPYLVIDSALPAEALNRLAAGRSEDFLLFLEAGLDPVDPRWLSRLMAYAQLRDVGAVGGLIRDAEGHIVSAGTVLGMNDSPVPGDAFGGQKPDPVSYYFYAEVARNVTAPARGCLLTRREVFDRVGGFDADRFGHTLSDVDYALRLAGQGLRCVQVGGVELLSPSPPRGEGRRSDAPTEQRALRSAYGTADRFYNPNLSAWDSFTPRSEAAHLIPATPAEPVRVLFGTHNLTAFEGAPKILQDVALGLTRRGTVTAAVFAPAPGKAASAFAGIPVLAEDTPFAKRYIDGQWTPAEYEAAQRQLAKLLREFRPQVVVANTLGLFPMVEAAARQHLPGVLAIQESYPEPLFASVFSPFGRWRCERAFQYADRVVFASRSCAELYRRLDGRKNFEVIHNGLAAAPFDEFRQRLSKESAVAQLPRPGVRHRIVTVGTVCERKAQHVLVEAAAKLARQHDFAYYLVGAREGLPYLSYVRNLIRARGLDDIVIPVTETDSVWTYLRAADVFVCSSYLEAFSLSVLEAEAFGLPIVSTPCGGLDEQVVWNRSALKFDFGNADQLADCLHSLLKDDAARAEMGRQSRAAFELRLTADGMLDCYQRVILSAARMRQPAASRAA